jgi:predicted deacylase
MMAGTPGREMHTVATQTLSNGHEMRLCVHEIVGAEDGPTVALVTGIHGDEPFSTELARRVALATDPALLRGRLRILPVANPYALQQLSRNTPIDMGDLNRLFPGNPDGTASEQLAHAIRVSVLDGCSCIIDVHSGASTTVVDYVSLDDESVDLVRAFGSRICYRAAPYPGSVEEYACRSGIPVVAPSIGGGQRRADEFLERGIKGIHNVLTQLGMLRRDLPMPIDQIEISRHRILVPRHGGFLHPQVGAERLGEEVPQGTVLGRVISPYTFDTLDEIIAPFERSLLILVTESLTKVNPGELSYIVGDASTAVPLL